MSGFIQVSLEQPFTYLKGIRYSESIQWNAFVLSMVYVVVIFSIKAFMSSRKPLNIKLPLQLWNLWLALFSIAGAVVTTKALLHEIFNYGLVASYTKCGDFFQDVSGLWTFWFCMSKMAELGDTIFIVLRKRPLIFLHWYHHVATLNYGIYSYNNQTAYNTWIVWLNFSVHAVMYTYYFLSACNIRSPAWISRLITSSQITQFLITLVILFHVGWLKATGYTVDTTWGVYTFCLLMELSYVYLFGKFFFVRYVKKQPRTHIE
ncbi:Elongation of very long chain fatty acids protein [Aphelenchoides besseyi]|nr:Elongation of very long chain fatty acids protein [Aphelenchoides besseyi]KAI6194136.1 Elongation of very long chain fatty acids protein [Aphelenchoides besseyi]